MLFEVIMNVEILQTSSILVSECMIISKFPNVKNSKQKGYRRKPREYKYTPLPSSLYIDNGVLRYLRASVKHLTCVVIISDFR